VAIYKEEEKEERVVALAYLILELGHWQSNKGVEKLEAGGGMLGEEDGLESVLSFCALACACFF
jgi:hypothetical protein